MKKIMFIMAVVAIVASAQANVLSDGGFESLDLGPQAYHSTGWAAESADPTSFNVVNTKAHSGTKSFEVTNIGDWGNIHQDYRASAAEIENMDWTLSAWVYYDKDQAGNDVSSDYFSLKFFATNDWNVHLVNMSWQIQASELTDGVWTYVEKTVAVGAKGIAPGDENYDNLVTNRAQFRFEESNGGTFYVDDVSLKRTYYWFDNTPANNSEVFPDTPLELSWVLPESESVTTVDVVISEVSDSELWDATNSTTVVDGLTDVEAVNVTVTENTTYYWQITTDDGVDVLVSEIMEFTTTDSNPTPVVVVGSDVLTYTVEGTVDVTVSGTVTDNGSTINTWSFTKSPDTIADAVIATPGALSTVVTLTEAGEYTLTLSGDDGEFFGQDSLKIYVGVDPCDAAKRDPRGYTAFLSDTNNDCKVSLIDFALIAKNWMKDNSLNGPVVLEPVVPE
jgi:hypothetical protein